MAGKETIRIHIVKGDKYMANSSKEDRIKMITFIGMAVMIIAVAVKAATNSIIAAAAIHGSQF